jgi:Ca2+-binding EF-hand superfamily protein
MVKEIDHDGDDNIGYTEFLSATVDINKLLTDDKVDELFGMFDLDGSGDLDIQEIK